MTLAYYTLALVLAIIGVGAFAYAKYQEAEHWKSHVQGEYLTQQDIRTLHIAAHDLADIVRNVKIACPVCKSRFYAHPQIPWREES